MKLVVFVLSVAVWSWGVPCQAKDCAECHSAVTPNIVSDWKTSKHASYSVGCAACHSDAHSSAEDVAKAGLPTAETCRACHKDQFAQFSKGKHALAWAAMKAMPTFHWQPSALVDGMKGCGGCHKIGLKTQDEIKELKKSGSGFGHASCDSCHTRHAFSKAEAQQPQACATCHMGFDHPQWEMYSTSKHGVRFQLKQHKILPEEASAPSCQTCHVVAGNHNNRTAWGFLALRLPMPADARWQKDRATILRALGVLDGEGKTTSRFEVFKAADLFRSTEEAWQELRNASLKACAACHSRNFARAELEKADSMIREADRVMAEAITIVAGLYRDGILKKPASYAEAFPDLLAFHDAPTEIEHQLFLMFMEYRMRTFQGAFHANPDYTFWYGWSALQQALTGVKEKESAMRRIHEGK